MIPNEELKNEALSYFNEFNKVQKEYNRLSKLREEKLGALGYISYSALFLGVMALVGLKINDIKGSFLYIIIGAVTAASAIYILISQILIGIYEKKGKKKRDKEFSEVKAKYQKLLSKRDFYLALKECDFDEAKAADLLKKRKAEEKLLKAEANKNKTVVKKQFDDSICVYCKKGICMFEGDETVYSFRCNPENCQWKSKKKL
jgi:hypothetical protein